MTSRFFHSAVVQNEQVPVVTVPLFCAIKGVPSSCLEKKQTKESVTRSVLDVKLREEPLNTL